jgi:hypothetical protein
LHSRTEGFHRVPGIVDIEDGVVVVLKVITVDWDVSSANKARATISKLWFLLVKARMKSLRIIIDFPWYNSAYRGRGLPQFSGFSSS